MVWSQYARLSRARCMEFGNETTKQHFRGSLSFYPILKKNLYGRFVKPLALVNLHKYDDSFLLLLLLFFRADSIVNCVCLHTSVDVVMSVGDDFLGGIFFLLLCLLLFGVILNFFFPFYFLVCIWVCGSYVSSCSSLCTYD